MQRIAGWVRVALAGGWFVACAPAPAPCAPCAAPPVASSAPAVPAASSPARDPKLDELGAERVALARRRIDFLRLSYERGGVSLGDLIAAYRNVAFAARDSGLRGEALRAALEAYAEAAGKAVEQSQRGVDSGRISEADLLLAKANAAEAALWLLEAKERN